MGHSLLSSSGNFVSAKMVFGHWGKSTFLRCCFYSNDVLSDAGSPFLPWRCPRPALAAGHGRLLPFSCPGLCDGCVPGCWHCDMAVTGSPMPSTTHCLSRSGAFPALAGQEEPELKSEITGVCSSSNQDSSQTTPFSGAILLRG